MNTTRRRGTHANERQRTAILIFIVIFRFPRIRFAAGVFCAAINMILDVVLDYRNFQIHTAVISLASQIPASNRHFCTEHHVRYTENDGRKMDCSYLIVVRKRLGGYF